MNRPRVFAIDGIVPVIDPSAYVHPAAVLIGDVIVGPGCYVGPCASLRGDFGRLILEEGVNVQDTCVMHGFPGTDTVIEQDGHIGHGAVLHGCRIGRNALVGMNAVIMDQVVIGEHAIIGLRPAGDLADPFDLSHAGDVRWSSIPRPRASCPTCSPA